MKMTEDQMLDVIEKLDARRLHEEPDEENTMEYLEELDKIHQKLTTLNLATFESNEVNRLIGRAYRAGLTCNIEQADPLAGYSNLTAAIKAGEPIDWERLDGLNVKCVNPGLRGELHGTLKRDPARVPERPWGWLDESMDEVYTLALIKAWYGESEWTLWVKGEIPLRRKTADQLEAYTYFYGEAPSGEPDLMYIGGSGESSKIIYYAPEMHKTDIPATEWVVIEEYGPFQRPEENKK